MQYKLNSKMTNYVVLSCMIAIMGLALIFVNVLPAYAMYGGYHSLDTSLSGGGSTPVNVRWVQGFIATPNPTLDDNSHKDYMVYVTEPFSNFVAGAGLYFQKVNNSVAKCHLKLYYTDAAPNQNFHLVNCVNQPTGNVFARIEQPTDNVNTWKGTSGAYQDSWTGTSTGGRNPTYYGAVVGSTTNNLNLYSSFSSLQVKDWNTGTLYNFSTAPGLFKCWFNSGYKYQSSSLNAFQTGPPTITVDQCADQIGFAPTGGEWP